MPIRPEIQERAPLENVEIEYERAGTGKKTQRPGFNRARLLDITRQGLEMGCREVMDKGTPLTLTIHLRNIPNFAKLQAEVQQSTRVTILR